jgi:hypothetical protein
MKGSQISISVLNPKEYLNYKMPQQISQNILPLVSQVPTPWKKVSHDRMTSAKMHPGVFTRCQYLLSSAQQLRSISPGCELIICICARTSLPQLVWPPKIADEWWRGEGRLQSVVHLPNQSIVLATSLQQLQQQPHAMPGTLPNPLPKLASWELLPENLCAWYSNRF